MKTCGLLIVLFGISLLGRGADIDFNRDIRPIISENCVHCHGPDAESREADLRLDNEAGAVQDLGGYQAVVPHSLEDSELWLRVDLDESHPDLMPPRKSKRKLTAGQKDLLKRWIESGGKYEEHWAFVKPVKAEIAEGATSAVDYFVGKKLREKGLEASPAADPRTLIRRAYLDVIGLPPSPEEVDQFLAAYQKNPEAAFRTVVDTLLESPRFGERWARQWLDLARYADSNGFQADQLRDSWAYRDWVIKALNDNMPYDRFTVEQLAGDLLPGATLDQKIATGFHRTVTCNVEAGVHAEENRTNQVVDRVNTTGTVWLGITMECAQCHDHKYDPFSMKDYYQLFAFFNNTPLEVQLPSSKTDVSHDFIGPFMDLPQPAEVLAERKALEAEMKTLAAEKEALAGAGPFETWLTAKRKSLSETSAWEVLEFADFTTTGGETVEILQDGSALITGKLATRTTYNATARSSLKTINGIRLEALTHERIPGKGPGRGDPKRTNFVLTDFKMRVDGKPVSLVNSRADFSQTRWEVAGAVDSDPKSGWGIAPQFGKDHWASFETAEPVVLNPGSQIAFVLDHQYPGGRTLGRVRISATSGDPGVEALSPEIRTILAKDNPSKKELKQLRELFESSSSTIAALEKRRKSIDGKLKALAPDQTLVMEELPEARMTNILMRGNYLSKGDPVTAGTPEVLPAISPDLPKNRLGLAKWLVDRENPLVARVAVNRWWAEIFGRGIVATLEDFGTQSEPPTHPELLDWLAVELMDSGWDMKHIIKTILLSDTYKQSARITARGREVDPANHYLSRASRFRLDAERIRDNSLAVSGLLSTKMYGRPIMPHQPDNIWRQVGRNEPKWIEAKNEDRWRRGIYIVYRRAAPYPSMVNFDAPDRGSCTVERPRTNTPLQALTLLNDPAYVEMALAFADRVLTESESSEVDQQIDTAFQIAFSRNAKPKEIEHLKAVLDERTRYYSENEKAAVEVIKGASNTYRAKTTDEVELAAWFYIGNILLNLDEMITKS
ncbi:MAG: PSD1 and planctomycete cytochrome C domain-containing protein [Verrucomicrobiales bacterium]|nr:PSD1 and planctomycete cytochrome C domain-containing protein [Verrucomicrobiales bacterium]